MPGNEGGVCAFRAACVLPSSLGSEKEYMQKYRILALFIHVLLLLACAASGVKVVHRANIIQGTYKFPELQRLHPANPRYREASEGFLKRRL